MFVSAHGCIQIFSQIPITRIILCPLLSFCLLYLCQCVRVSVCVRVCLCARAQNVYIFYVCVSAWLYLDIFSDTNYKDYIMPAFIILFTLSVSVCARECMCARLFVRARACVCVAIDLVKAHPHYCHHSSSNKRQTLNMCVLFTVGVLRFLYFIFSLFKIFAK